MKLQAAILAIPLLMACTNTVRAENGDRIGELSWLSGTWTSEHDGSWTEEHWTAAKGQLMLGLGRSGSADKVASFEHLRIQLADDGTPVYLAAPGGREATPFRMVEAGPASAVFENPEHDFPQRIRYWREGNELFAEISAIDGSNKIGWSLALVD